MYTLPSSRRRQLCKVSAVWTYLSAVLWMILWEDPLTLSCQGYHETRKVPKVHASLRRLSRSATMANFRRHLHTKRNNPSQSHCKEDLLIYLREKVWLIFLFSGRKCSEEFLDQGANDGLEANPIYLLSLYTVLLKGNVFICLSWMIFPKLRKSYRINWDGIDINIPSLPESH